MFEQFDNQNDDEDIKKTAAAEFERLKQFMTEADGKRYKDQFFNWTDCPQNWGETFLVLGEVAAQFFDDGKRDVAKKGQYRFRFGQRPLTAHEQSSGEYVYPEVWELTADVLEGGTFVWLVDGKRVLPTDLPDAIARHLAEVFDAYEEAVSL
jgi:hypothetical protein